MKLTTRAQCLVFIALASLMVATRGHHFSTAISLPSASLAVFFLAGFYLRSMLTLPVLIALAGGLDVASVLWGGVSAECFGPSYPFLAIAYSALWLGGRWVETQYQPSLSRAMPMLATLAAALLASSFISHLFSSGSYYLLSGSFENPSLTEFGARIARYYPASLQSLAFYVGSAAVIHLTLHLANRISRSGEIS